MTRILLRASKDPFTVIRPEAVLSQRLIGNTGNLLFSDSVHATLSVPDATIVTIADLDRSGDDAAFAARINEQFDHLVVPLANAFRTTFLKQLDNITRTIERLDIPVTVVGVGTQGEMDGMDLELASDSQGKETVRRFCSAVLDRSATIGVRGEITQRFLAGLGFGGALGSDVESRQRVAERLNWLRQGIHVDRTRRWETYRPAFGLTPGRAKPFNAQALDDVRKRTAHHQDRIDRLAERSRRQQDQIKELTRIVQKQHAQLADAERARKRLPAKVSRRLRRVLRSVRRRIGFGA